MTTAFDIRHPDLVLHELDDLNRQVAREPEVPDWIGNWLADLCTQIGETVAADLEGVSEHDWSGLQAAALRLAGVVFQADDADPRILRRRVRLGIEELRFRMARLAETQAVNDTQPIEEITRWLDETLELSQAEKGALVGVSDRTWQRWNSEHEHAEPTGEAATKLRLLARVVNELRHTLTATGAVRWAASPLPELGGATPLDVFGTDNLQAVAKVFAVIAAARSGAAA
jgi:DNA-binding transcriptional regulator YiaG